MGDLQFLILPTQPRIRRRSWTVLKLIPTREIPTQEKIAGRIPGRVDTFQHDQRAAPHRVLFKLRDCRFESLRYPLAAMLEVIVQEQR